MTINFDVALCLKYLMGGLVLIAFCRYVIGEK